MSKNTTLEFGKSDFIEKVFPGLAEKPGNQTGMFPGFGISQNPLRPDKIRPEPEYLSLV